MRIIPAIDIINGQCVRLTKGDYSTKKVYNENPLEVAKMFCSNVKLLPARKGERNTSGLVKKNLSNTIYKIYGKIQLKNYIKNFINQK